MKTNELQVEYEAVKSQYTRRNEEYEIAEREIRKLQEKHREVRIHEYAFNTAKDHLEASLKVA